jgi:membrane protein
VFSLSPYFADLQQLLEDFLFQQLLPQNYEVVNHYIHQFIASAQKLKGNFLPLNALALILIFSRFFVSVLWQIFCLQFIASAQKLKGISVLFLLVAVFFLFREVEHRINSVWEAKKTRHFGLDLLIYLLVYDSL